MTWLDIALPIWAFIAAVAGLAAIPICGLPWLRRRKNLKKQASSTP